MSYGLYVHTPFCVVKCPYCDFFSGVFPDDMVGPWFAAVETEIELRRDEAPDGPVDSVFIGGGTPTALPVPVLERLLDHIHRRLPLAPDCEISVEANPESFDDETAACLAAAGVDRISLGIQSLDDRILSRLGRPHDAAQARAAIGLARARFARVSCDVISAVPDMTRPILAATLDGLLTFELDHLSVYDLMIEPGTAFATAQAAGELEPMDDDTALALDDLIGERAARHGLSRYEVSNYARPGDECRHNLGIWRGGWYLGVGPSAHSYLPAARPSFGRRVANVRQLHAYSERLAAGALPPVEEEWIDRRRYVEERLLLGLRLTEGIDVVELAGTAAHGSDMIPAAVVDGLCSGGVLERAGNRLRTTEAGRRVLDDIVARLVMALGDC